MLAATDNIGLFFGEDIFVAIASILLILKRLYPDAPLVKDVEVLADQMLTKEKVGGELADLDREYSGGFERPYGWAWLLALHQEAALHEDRASGRLQSGPHPVLARHRLCASRWSGIAGGADCRAPSRSGAIACRRGLHGRTLAGELRGARAHGLAVSSRSRLQAPWRASD